MITHPPSLPKLPGVYLFKDAQGTILYVGKARNLAHRVGTYFSARGKLDAKIIALLRDAHSIEHIVTQSERDALLLEEHLVKLYQPAYNVLLAHGQPFLYLHITSASLPELVITRTKKEEGESWGPFVQRSVVRRAYDYLMKTFQLVRCTNSIPQGCLKHHLGICAGACKGSLDEEAYRLRIELVRAVLNGETKQFLARVQQALATAHQQLAFERARQLHQYAHNFEEIFATIREAFSADTYRAEIAHAVTSSSVEQHKRDTQYEEAQRLLQELLQADVPLRTIDCFDISHHQSRHMVGSCIRFMDGVPDRSQFRRFRIKTMSEQNDYAALQEIVTRRYRNLQSLPDLVLIDGGKGQLSAVQQVLPGARIVSLAKREERLFTPLHREGVVLDPGSAMGKLLISLRDYAHHFAVTYHSLLSKKEYRTKKGNK